MKSTSFWFALLFLPMLSCIPQEVYCQIDKKLEKKKQDSQRKLLTDSTQFEFYPGLSDC